jgi:hypothetical protein
MQVVSRGSLKHAYYSIVERRMVVGYLNIICSTSRFFDNDVASMPIANAQEYWATAQSWYHSTICRICGSACLFEDHGVLVVN